MPDKKTILVPKKQIQIIEQVTPKESQILQPPKKELSNKHRLLLEEIACRIGVWL